MYLSDMGNKTMEKPYLICYFDHDFLLGGAQTYYIRMLAWAKASFNKILILNKGTIIAEEWKLTVDKLDIKVLYLDAIGKWLYDSKNCKIRLDLTKHSVCIVTGISQYIRISNVFKDDLYLNLVLYVLHPTSCQISQKYFLINLFCEYRAIRKICNKNMYFMDEETLEYAQKCYPNISFSQNNIIRLGMDVKDYNESVRKKVCGLSKFCILTVSRLEFPFKGYILGLIKDFALLHNKYPDMELNIIGGGEGMAEVETILSDYDEKIKQDIHLIGYVAYEELAKYFERSHLYVGMGTTVLDASMRGVPAIVATGYQRENFCCGYFYDNYKVVGKLINESGAQDYHFYDLIEKIYQMSIDEYLEKCRLSYKIVKENYDIELIMNRLISLSAKITRVNSMLLKFFVALRSKKRQSTRNKVIVNVKKGNKRCK